MDTIYEIYRLDGPQCLGRHFRDSLYRDLARVAEQADNIMRKRGWFAVGVRPEGSRGQWSYLNTREADPGLPAPCPPPALVPLPMRDNPVAVTAA